MDWASTQVYGSTRFTIDLIWSDHVGSDIVCYHQNWLCLPKLKLLLYYLSFRFDCWVFVNCIGGIDRKFVLIQKSNYDESELHNNKQRESIVLMAVCDADYKFTLLDVSQTGTQNDGETFEWSDFGRTLLLVKLWLDPSQTHQILLLLLTLFPLIFLECTFNCSTNQTTYSTVPTRRDRKADVMIIYWPREMTPVGTASKTYGTLPTKAKSHCVICPALYTVILHRKFMSQDGLNLLGIFSRLSIAGVLHLYLEMPSLQAVLLHW